MDIRSKRMLAAALLAAVVVPATAADRSAGGLYGGIAGGRSEARDACEQFSAAFPGAACDRSGTGWRVTAGYQPLRFLAVEFEYARLGEADAAATIGGATVQARARAEGVGVLVSGGFPAGDRLELFVKAGLFRWEAEAEAGASRVSDDGQDPTFGLGARWRLQAPFWLTAEWRRYRDVGERDVTGRSDVDLVTLGLELRP